jgi:serine/threonine protein kinase
MIASFSLRRSGRREDPTRTGPREPSAAEPIDRRRHLQQAPSQESQRRKPLPGCGTRASEIGLPVVVLTDFGIAVIDDRTALTATGQLLGSPAYLAPERINGPSGGSGRLPAFRAVAAREHPAAVGDDGTALVWERS